MNNAAAWASIAIIEGFALCMVGLYVAAAAYARRRWKVAQIDTVPPIAGVSLSAIQASAKERWRAIMKERERYIEAWIAETGYRPSQCQLVELHEADRTVVYITRKRGPV